MAYINIMEKMVEIRLEEHMKDGDFCRCERCIEDVMCIALNKLEPKYVSTDKGELFSNVRQRMNRQSMLDLDVAIINALDFVKKRPSHD